METPQENPKFLENILPLEILLSDLFCQFNRKYIPSKSSSTNFSYKSLHILKLGFVVDENICMVRGVSC